MEPVEYAAVHRAHTALNLALSDQSHTANLRCFHQLMFAGMRARGFSNLNSFIGRSEPEIVHRAAELLSGSTWSGSDVKTLLRAFLNSIAPRSLLDSMAQYARVLPADYRAVISASGFTGDMRTEGQPAAVKQAGLSQVEGTRKQAAALIVLSDILADQPEGAALFRVELENAVVKACNSGVLAELLAQTGSPTVTAGGTTGDALEDLRKLLRSMPASDGIVVAATVADVYDLSTRIEAAGSFGVRGGVFRPGLVVVPVETMPSHLSMLGIAASSIAMADFGLRVTPPAKNATIQLTDSPVTPSASTVMTSLFQGNLVALAATREFELYAPPGAVVTLGA